ncbi:MAG TPA: acetyl-CoA carboxylase carboxyltransferase subunit alpha/beta [Thermomicrobiales bacterium]|jgi:acetyl-CoA carboxylase carboxyl transferase subunit beta
MRRFFGFRQSRPHPIPHEVAADGAPPICPRCEVSLAGDARYERYRVCSACGAHLAIGSRQRVDGLVDEGSFRETLARLFSADPLAFTDDAPYRRRLEEQRRVTGQADALITGTAAVHGHKIVVAVLDFAFMGGSMGVVVGEKLVRAAELAGERRVPLLSIVASGGARMQEGMFSLLQMAKTATAIQRLHNAGVPYVSVLTHPTTGGVFASFASLGDVILAEPGALIGFAGPRVAEQFLGRPLPPGSHTAEFLLEHGLIDDIVDRVALRGYLGVLFGLLQPRDKPRAVGATKRSGGAAAPPADVWPTVQAARDPARPTTVDYLGRMLDRFVELHGDRESGDDPAIVAGFGGLAGRSLAVIGIERGHGDEAARRRQGRPMPEGFRKAQRVMRLAARFRLPLLALVDTPGAYPGIEAEERGLAGEIAESMATMSDLPVPIVAAIVGEGGSGGALALAVADRVLMQETAIYSVIAPEGAAAILYRDAGRAPELAAKLKITAADLLGFGIVDAVVPEPSGGAASDPDQAAALLKTAIVAAFDELGAIKRDRLVQSRGERYRSVGRRFAVKSPLPPERSESREAGTAPAAAEAPAG